MTKEESSRIVDRVKIYRQNFVIGNSIYAEWFRILEPYDYEDVNKKLEEYLRNADNYNRIPDPYYLTKFLNTIEQKEKKEVIIVSCTLCGKKINILEYEIHYSRCLSAKYLCKESKKHFNRELDYERLMNAPDKKFEDFYWDFSKKLLDQLPDGIQKHSLENSIRLHEGKEIKFSKEEVFEQCTF